MGEMTKADLRGNELPFLILFEIGEEGTPRQIFSNIRHNFSANELASETVQSFEHKKWNPLYACPFEAVCDVTTVPSHLKRSEHLPDLCFSIRRFSQMVFIPRAQPHAQSLFLFPIVFGIISRSKRRVIKYLLEEDELSCSEASSARQCCLKE